MSSLRNSVQRRSHKERAQPLERQRLGLLEKKKDYQKRAKDYKKKQEVLKSLRQKVAEKNEDEFYFGMMSRKGPGSAITYDGKKRNFTGTVEGDRGNKAMDVETVRLLKTQDLGYLRTMRNVAAKEVRELMERVILAGGADVDDDSEDDDDDDDFEDFNQGMGGSKNKKKSSSGRTAPKKIVFFDAAEERQQKLQAVEDQEMQDFDSEEDEEKAKEAGRKARNLARLQNRLKQAKKKLQALTDAETELEITQAKMAKTRTSGGITKSGRRIKVKERKR
ncbi:U3 small nucleolar RNA-associated protein 11 [Neurospora hispaniola]|uniref:U3 small nucleolar RNA-associated protein 11 n=1 Tax=Neurospora hispaniola TaxID=588809 RepID=A0AAJ0IBM0_9PEZI|nr:U3 small nucleolar RNA-associated protein 11 [Neurospora hispaniola]